MSEETIELSIDETNKLRAELGLKPLNIISSSAPEAATTGQKTKGSSSSTRSGEELALSIDETNALRLKLGLAPLRTTNDNKKTKHGNEVEEEGKDDSEKQKPKFIHKPAENKWQQDATQERIDRARLKRQVQKGIQSTFGTATLADGDIDNHNDNNKGGGNGNGNNYGLTSWAQRMKHADEKIIQSQNHPSNPKPDDDDDDADNNNNNNRKKSKKSKKKKGKSSSGKDTDNNSTKIKIPPVKNETYDEKDLEGLQVGHNISEIESGSTTILTLADTSLLEQGQDLPDHLSAGGRQLLENINLKEQKNIQEGLKRKRQLELGAGRANAYAGYDDDEFEELGGTVIPSNKNRTFQPSNNNLHNPTKNDSNSNNTNQGFKIGQASQQSQQGTMTDVEAILGGNPISLQPHHGNSSLLALNTNVNSDYMTIEEDEQLQQKAKENKKTFKKHKKKLKKSKKRSRRNQLAQDDADNDDDDDDAAAADSNRTKLDRHHHTKTLLDQLEETAGEVGETSSNRKRRHHMYSDDQDQPNPKSKIKLEQNHPNNPTQYNTTMNDNITNQRRRRYDEVMSKGNSRVQAMFQQDPSHHQSTTIKRESIIEEEQDYDDSFLNEALAKARRLNRLKHLQQQANSSTRASESSLVETVNAIKEEQTPTVPSSAATTTTTTTTTTTATTSGTMTFAVDDTREFTRAILAKSKQENREQAKASSKNKSSNIISAKTTPVGSGADTTKGSNQDEIMRVKKQVTTDEVTSTNDDNDGNDDMEIEELAKKIKEIDNDSSTIAGLDGETANVAGVGRGLSSFVSMLKYTGEISAKNAGREELRGRAKDERNYDNYKPLDLSKVVRIGDNATEKDLEFAQRQVKLEYRDKHGRLLTPKEAFRELCYSFHGYRSSKKNEEKRLQQIAREQAQARLASQQVMAAREETTNAATNSSLASGSVGAGTLGALKATQKATGKAFVVHKT